MKKPASLILLLLLFSMNTLTAFADEKIKVLEFFPVAEKNLEINKPLGLMFVSRTNWNYNSQNIPTVYETAEIWKFTYNYDKQISGMLGFIAWGKLEQLTNLDEINKEITYLHKVGDFYLGTGYRIEGKDKNFITTPIFVKSKVNCFQTSWNLEGVVEPCFGLNVPGKLKMRNIAFIPDSGSWKIGLGGHLQFGPNETNFDIIRLLVRTGNNPTFDFGPGIMNSNGQTSFQLYVRLLFTK